MEKYWDYNKVKQIAVIAESAATQLDLLMLNPEIKFNFKEKAILLDLLDSARKNTEFAFDRLNMKSSNKNNK
tara:strand:+ start:538 stop:753 length:216 start_codon:yes stop_codon:yes gene_type:complete